VIGKLKGIVDSIATDHLLLDVGGVGYLVFASSRTLSRLPGEGEATSLLIDTHVREDHIHLYGFASEEERQSFRVLLTVQGVGTRLALAILSAFDAATLAQAIAMEDTKLLTRANGVGAKLASRMVTELKGKLDTGWQSAPVMQTGSATAPHTTDRVVQDAVSALEHLGYGKSESLNAVQRAHAEHPTHALERLIPEALRQLAA
jgi:Holliday junction DNA helicase RuvA